ncbi:alpha/beta hydrolase [Salinirubellus salinus]|uniref:Alpha/beta hydrolase n=1 Tax=Salinirubellus salinus TaxID=1364945 RepID=A0A9E7QZU4_9EURY|nr:alpha/beta hydrolase [Salinirubellus salinus]UWM53066.1 alpha/beta hydrolase [Salinirubellus salinus]
MTHTDWVAEQDSVHVETTFHEFEIAYREEGTGDSVTLFIHGIPTWGYLFREVYTAADHAVIPDLAGYGYTEHVGEGGYDRSLRLQEELLEGFLDELGHDSVQIVAHDIGGGAALRLAAHSPERVERLVLSNVACYDNWPVPFIHGLGQPDEARERTDEDVDAKLQFAFGEGTVGEDNAEFVAGMKAPFLDRDREPQALARNAISTNTNHTLEVAHSIPHIDVPTLLLWGGDDVLISTEWANRLAGDLPNVETEYLDSAYHWVMQDRPDAYREALEQFLD